MRRYKVFGYSLLEALVGLAILGLIISIALPPLSSWAANQRVRSVQTGLLQMIHRARYTALTHQQRVTLCPLSEQGKCLQNWNRQISSFIDTNGNRRLDPNEELLSTLYVPSSIIMHWRGMQPNNSMHFTARGHTSLSNGTMSLCSRDPKTMNATLTINVQGRARSATNNAKCSQ